MTGHALRTLPTNRLACLDIFRGLTMAAMVIVNNPGSWEHVYGPLRHAKWNGCTPTDLVFPFFMLAVGLSIPFSRTGRAASEAGTASAGAFWLKTLRRGALLILLGLLLNGFPYFILEKIRVTGVLPRIGVCFVLVSVLVRFTPVRWQVIVAGLALVGHTVLEWGFWIGSAAVSGAGTFSLSWPGHWANWPDPESNLARHLDVVMIGPRHLYKNAATDPEGVLGTFTACVSVLIGVWVGRALRATEALRQSPAEGAEGASTRPTRSAPVSWAFAARLLGLGCLGLVAGWLGDLWVIPLNKPLWTASYVLWTSGWGLLIFAAVYVLAPWRPLGLLNELLSVLGRNAIFLFVGSGLVARALTWQHVYPPLSGKYPIEIKQFLIKTVITPLDALPEAASLIFAILTLAAWWVVLWCMDRRGWWLKV